MNIFTNGLPEVETESLKVLLNGCLERFKEHHNERYNRFVENKQQLGGDTFLIDEFKITISETHEAYMAVGEISANDKTFCYAAIGKDEVESGQEVENKIYLKFIKILIDDALCSKMYN
jgi:hypothetical protein